MDSNRNMRFTSSQIYRLTSKDKEKGFAGYVKEVYYETLLGRRLDNETNARPTSWGNLVEKRAFDVLGIEYDLVSRSTIIHKDSEFSDYWCGTPDLIKDTHQKTVCDIKCPMTLKSFCTFYECNTIEDVIKLHKDGKKYYYQLVSNAILTESTHAELIIYVPYKSELEEIRDLANNYDGDQNKIAWINWANDSDLPYLIDGGYYNNIKKISFEVTDNIKNELIGYVRLAIAELENLKRN